MTKTTTLFALLLASFTFATAQAEPAPAGEVVGVGNYLHVVGDTEPVFDFYHDVLGMDLPPAVAAAPRVLPRPFITTPEIQDLYGASGVPYRNSVTMIAESAMRMETVEWQADDRKAIRPRLQDAGAGIMIMQVRDLDAIMARVRQAHATVITTGGKPIVVAGPQGNSRQVMLRDPDGFFVELVQPETLPAGAAQASNNIYEVAFAATVDDMPRMVDVFKAMGFDLKLGDWTRDAVRMRVAGLPAKARMRRTTSVVPGTSFQVALVEFDGVAKQHWHSRDIDPGTTMLRLRVRDMDAMLARMKAAGLVVASKDGQPVSVNNANGGLRIVNLDAPDNLKIQLMQAVPRPN